LDARGALRGRVLIFAVDTTILAYAEGVDDAHRRDRARQSIQLIARQTKVIPVQVLGELFLVLMRKKLLSPFDGRVAVLRWRAACQVPETSAETLASAMDLVVAHRLQFWDAVIISAAAEARADYLLSEDMQHGFSWRGLTILNPLSDAGHSELSALVARRDR
jgi:predicted nucleic acid-binding protein